MRDLPYLTSRLFGTPHLIRAGKLDAILHAITPYIASGRPLDTTPIKPPTRAEYDYGGGAVSLRGGAMLLDDGIAVLPVLGTLVRRGSWLDAESGLTSYHSLTDTIAESLLSTRVRGLLLEFDSYGGEANGCFDLADFIKKAARQTGKPVWAHANECACSAAYALASAAERIWLPRTGEIGSIGVVSAHVDQSGADKKAGLKWTFIFEGDHKLHGNPHRPLEDKAQSAAQADSRKIYNMFCNLVARNRGISAARVKATKADVYRGSDAVEAGLANRVGTFEECLDAFASRLNSRGR